MTTRFAAPTGTIAEQLQDIAEKIRYYDDNISNSPQYIGYVSDDDDNYDPESLYQNPNFISIKANGDVIKCKIGIYSKELSFPNTMDMLRQLVKMVTDCTKYGLFAVSGFQYIPHIAYMRNLADIFDTPRRQIPRYAFNYLYDVSDPDIIWGLVFQCMQCKCKYTNDMVRIITQHLQSEYCDGIEAIHGLSKGRSRSSKYIIEPLN